MSTFFSSSPSSSSSSASPKEALDSLLANAPLSDRARGHLVRVYALLSVCVVAAAAGAALHLRTNAGGLLTTLLSFGAMAYIQSSRGSAPESNRKGALAGFALLQGMSVGPLISLAVRVDPSLIVTAFVGTACVFLCFTASALTARKNTYVALGGVLGSGVSLLLWLGLASFFFPSAALFQARLYIGLLVFSGYVLYDTQLIVRRASSGAADAVSDAMHLFVNAVAIFVRVLIILLQNSGKKEDKKRSSSSRR